jgi:hypothetical protein
VPCEIHVSTQAIRATCPQLRRGNEHHESSVGTDNRPERVIGEKKTEPQDVRDAVRAALGAGADGVILSCKYSEMRLVNLRAAGEALHG